MRHGEEPPVSRQSAERSPKSSTVPKPVRGKTVRPKARAKTAREKENVKGRRVEVRKEENHPRADASSAEVNAGPQDACKTRLKKLGVRLKQMNGDVTWRRR